MRRLMRPALLLLLVAAVALPAIADKAKDLLQPRVRTPRLASTTKRPTSFFKQAYDRETQRIFATGRLRTHPLPGCGLASCIAGRSCATTANSTKPWRNSRKRLAIDPSCFIAQQELRRTQKMINDQRQSAAPGCRTPAGLAPQAVHEAAGPVELTPISNVPITLKIPPKTEVIYETVGKLAGINVLFDPDYTSRAINVDLNGVTLEEALEIIALESKTFWRPVTPNTIFVAADNPAKRKELEQSVIKTFYLTNLSPADRVAGRRERDAHRARCAAHAAVAFAERHRRARDARSDRAGAEACRRSRQGAPEVIVDIAVMQVSKDRTRTLGITPPTSATRVVAEQHQ